MIVDYKTEGIKYMGSKKLIIPHIWDTIKDLQIKSALDLFSGTTRVSQFFAKNGFDVCSNDISVWSNTFATCYLLSNKPDKYYKEILDELDNLSGIEGFITENYGGDVNDGIGKKPFGIHNTKKVDVILEWLENNSLDNLDKSVILTSLILGLDKVDNTIGHYVSYPKGWSSRSKNTLTLELPKRFPITGNASVTMFDCSDSSRVFEGYDLIYLDPPYGSNNDKMPSSRVRYSSYYHIWETIIRNDKPKLFGKCNRREDSRDNVRGSVYESYNIGENGRYEVYNAIDNLISRCHSRYVLLSYNNKGRITYSDITEILQRYGKILDVRSIDYKSNVMGNMSWTNDWVVENGSKLVEFLFLLERK